MCNLCNMLRYNLRDRQKEGYTPKNVKMVFDYGLLGFNTIDSYYINFTKIIYCPVCGKKFKITKCKNCGKYFVTANRTDELYCDNLSPQNPRKTCKEIGATQVFKNKKNNEEKTAEQEHKEWIKKLKKISMRNFSQDNANKNVLL